MKNINKKTIGLRGLTRIALCLCMAFVLSLNLFAPAVSAETAQASDMRLQGTEGTVSVINGSGKEVSVWESMKLYSGYSVSTAENSCAYISLDSDKLVKLDSQSQLELRKSGDKLELLLSSGQLLFNVTKPLEDKESMNIRTSTMVTGIRGTSGYVQALSGGSAVTVLDGKVELTASYSGQTQTLSAGNTATDNDQGDINISGIDKDAVPSFVLLELRRDEALAARVQEESGLNVNELLEGIDQRVAQERQEAELARIRQAELVQSLPNDVSRPEGFEIPYIPYVPETVPAPAAPPVVAATAAPSTTTPPTSTTTGGSGSTAPPSP